METPTLMSTMKRCKIRKKIPRFAQNDASNYTHKGEGIGGEAADSFSPLSLQLPVIPNEVRNLTLTKRH